MKKSIFLTTILVFFILGNFAQAKTIEWNFDRANNYFFNKKKITIMSEEAGPKLDFVLSTETNISTDKLSQGSIFEDLDGDGDKDFYIANWGQNYLWINQGNNKFINKNIPGDKGKTQAVAVGDFDGNGSKDIYTANFDGQNNLWLNDGKGNFTLFKIHNDNDGSYFVVVDDFDKDGRDDIYVKNSVGKDKLWLAKYITSTNYIPFIANTNAVYLTKPIEVFSADTTGDVKFQVSFDGGKEWYYWKDQWVKTEKMDGTEVSTADEIDANIKSFPAQVIRFKWRAYLNSTTEKKATISQIQIIYNDKNYPPEFNLDSDLFKINEGQTEVATFVATEKNVKQIITYEIEGKDAEFFRIDGSSGKLTFIEKPDFERPLDSNRDNIYELTIIAQDNGKPIAKSKENIKVEVKNVDLKIISNEGKPEVKIDLDEDLKEITTIMVENPEGVELKYSLAPKGDYNFFELDDKQMLKFKINTRVTEPKDLNKDNIYEVEVVVSDNLNLEKEARQKIIVKVLEVEVINLPPKLIIDQETSPIQIDNQDLFVYKIKATDPDGNKLRFSLGEELDSKLFKINSLSGDLLFAEIPNYQNPQDQNKDSVYEVVVQVKDLGVPNKTTAQKIYIFVDPQNKVSLIDFPTKSKVEVCKDPKALNYYPLGVSNKDLCKYKEVKKVNKVKSDINCPAKTLLTQNMIIGDRDQKYSGWERKVITEVKILQEHLIRLGTSLTEANGIFDLKTREAVMEMQDYFKINDSGIVDAQFRKKINSSCNLDLKKTEEEIQKQVQEKRRIKIEELTEAEKKEVNQYFNQIFWIMQSIVNRVR